MILRQDQKRGVPPVSGHSANSGVRRAGDGQVVEPGVSLGLMPGLLRDSLPRLLPPGLLVMAFVVPVLLLDLVFGPRAGWWAVLVLAALGLLWLCWGRFGRGVRAKTGASYRRKRISRRRSAAPDDGRGPAQGPDAEGRPT
jgi:hypothetical protein